MKKSLTKNTSNAILLSVCFVALFSLISSADSTVITLNESNGGLLASNTVFSVTPDTNTPNSLRTGLSDLYRGFLLWNLSFFPSNAVIENANLSLFKYYGSTQYIVAYNTSNAWTESGLIWNNQPAADTLQDNISATDSSWNYYNVTNSTKYSVAQSQNMSIVLKNTQDETNYYDKDSADATLRPQLVISYSIPSDTQPPTYSLNSTNSTLNGTDVKHSLYWQDVFGLSGYIFSFRNGSGNFVNDSWVAFTGTGNWSNVTKSVNSTVGANISFMVYANDTSNNWNVSNVFSYLTTNVPDTTPPTYSNQTQNASVIISGSVILSAYLSDETALDSAWLSTNESGSWQNKTKDYCYQETANVSTSCGGLSTGSYYFNIHEEPNTFDGNWGTSAAVSSCPDWSGYMYVNYTKPINAVSATWMAKDFLGTTTNYTLSSTCYAQNNIQLRIYEACGFYPISKNYACNNGTDWNTFATFSDNGEQFFEEAMWWELGTSPLNLTLNQTAWSNFTWQNSSVLDTTIGWKIFFNDTSGNINSTDIMSFIVDSVNPSLILQSPLNTTYFSTNITLNYTASDTNLNTTWYFYNGTNTTITGNTTFTALNNQQSNLTLYVNDSAGNINSTSVTFSVDSTPPTYSNLSINNSAPKVNESIKISALWNDSFSSLSQYIFSWNGSSITQTITLNETNGGNIGDTYVDLNVPNTNYGTSNSLEVAYASGVWQRQTYSLWDLNSSMLPANVNITNVMLLLYTSSTNSVQNVSIYNTSNNWNEMGLTWNNQPSIDTYQSNLTVTGSGWYAWNVTNAAISQYGNTSNKNLSLSIFPNITNANRITFFSKNYTTNTSRTPQLVITYTVRGWSNDTAVSFTSNFSNITKTVSDAKGTRIDYKIFANDSYGNMNVTAQNNFTVANTPPTTIPSIIPSPTDGSQPLNCVVNFYDLDGDNQNQTWFKWYKNNALLSATTSNLTNGNFTNNDNIICSVMVNDGTNNSTFSNSTVLTINDITPPVYNSITYSATSGTINTAFTVTTNITETNSMGFSKMEVEDPNQQLVNLTMTQDSRNGSIYIYSVSYTPIIVGTYHFNFTAKDGSGNPSNYSSSVTYTTSSLSAPPAAGGGGGTTVVTQCGNKVCEVNENAQSCPVDCAAKFQLLETQFDRELKKVVLEGGLFGGNTYEFRIKNLVDEDLNMTFSTNTSWLKFDMGGSERSVFNSKLNRKGATDSGIGYIRIVAHPNVTFSNMTLGEFQVTDSHTVLSIPVVYVKSGAPDYSEYVTLPNVGIGLLALVGLVFFAKGA